MHLRSNHKVCDAHDVAPITQPSTEDAEKPRWNTIREKRNLAKIYTYQLYIGPPFPDTTFLITFSKCQTIGEMQTSACFDARRSLSAKTTIPIKQEFKNHINLKLRRADQLDKTEKLIRMETLQEKKTIKYNPNDIILSSVLLLGPPDPFYNLNFDFNLEKIKKIDDKRRIRVEKIFK